MVREKIPSTRAVLALRKAGVEFTPHFYKYDKDAVTEAAAAEVGVSTHEVVKTLVMEEDSGDPFIVLMHGDMQVSTKGLARLLGVKSVSPVSVRSAERLTGYMVGGITPFGTRRELKVYVEGSILSLPRLYINGGRRGFLVELSPDDLVKVLDPTVVNIGRE
jgi:Cys-tRNA(Pro) deacylase